MIIKSQILPSLHVAWWLSKMACSQSYSWWACVQSDCIQGQKNSLGLDGSTKSDSCVPLRKGHWMHCRLVATVPPSCPMCVYKHTTTHCSFAYMYSICTCYFQLLRRCGTALQGKSWAIPPATGSRVPPPQVSHFLTHSPPLFLLLVCYFHFLLSSPLLAIRVLP